MSDQRDPVRDWYDYVPPDDPRSRSRGRDSTVTTTQREIGMSETTAKLDDYAKEAHREDAARGVMLVMGTVYSIGFIMGGIVCGLVGIFAGWVIWG